MSVPPLFLGPNATVTNDTFDFGNSFATTSQTPIKTYDVTNKLYVDDVVNIERKRIDNLTDAIGIDINKLKDLKDFLDSLPLESLTSIISEIGIKITGLKNDLAQEILDRDAAIQSIIDMVTLEYDARLKSEAEINDKIDLFIGTTYGRYILNNDLRSTRIETSVSTEVDARIQEDNSIKQTIAALETKIENDILTAKTDTINRITELSDAESLARRNADIEINAELIRIEGKLDTEISDRINAVSDLQLQIDNLDYSSVLDIISKEISDRQAGDASLQDKIDAERDLREGADITIRADIQTEITSRINQFTLLKDKIDTEITDRSTGDTDIISRITAEENTRSEDDKALGDRITAEQGARVLAYQSLQTNIDAEVITRGVEDAKLRDRIGEEENVRLIEDTKLNNKIDDEIFNRSSQASTLQTAIETEVNERSTEDTKLGQRIDAEENERLKEDTKLNNKMDAEALTRETADTALQSKITNFVNELTSEATIRSEGITKLTTDLETETTERKNNDNTLQTLIDAEVTARTNKDADLESQIIELKALLTKMKTDNKIVIDNYYNKINALYLTFWHKSMDDSTGVDANYQMTFQYGPGAI